MEVYVARQPIYDNDMNVYGYELLYRKSMNNFYEGTDDNQATAELIENSFLTMNLNELTTGTRAFINFPADLIEKDIPLLLPKDIIAIELLERVKPSNTILEKCKELKKLGYIIVLDDFVFSEAYEPFIEVANIIKIEIRSVTKNKQQQLIDKYGKDTKFLAEKVETLEEYNTAIKMGYDYFQGYYFNKPVIIKSAEVGKLNANLIRLLNAISQDEINYREITSIIETDLGLTYKLMKIVNSLHYYTKNQIKSIKHALAMFGTKEIRKWIYLMLLRETQNINNKELIKNSLIRGKLMELIIGEIGEPDNKTEYFIVGLFSSIDIILNKSMEEVMEMLPFTKSIKDALLGKQNQMRKILDIILCYENNDWKKIRKRGFLSISKDAFMEIYLESLKWYMDLGY